MCAASGSPGTWRKLGGPATAGAFHAIAPARACDSRVPAPSPGALASGANRLISVADKRNLTTGAVVTSNIVAANATAVFANVTVAATSGQGFLAINPGGNTTVGASSINWSSSGQALANGLVLPVDTSRRVTVICGGGGSTQFVIDVSGYYL